MAITIFTSKHCTPCQEVEELVKEGKFDGEVELVDIESDEGFKRFTEEVLNHGDGFVPSAYKDGQQCAIKVEEGDRLIFECPTDGPPSAA